MSKEIKKELGNRIRNFIFTINNPPEHITKDELLKLITKRYKCNYVIIGEERGKEKNTLHYQGFISLKNNTYFLNVKNYLEICIEKGIWLHEAYGTPKDNEKYCSKDGDYVEFGNAKQTNEKMNSDLIDDILNDVPYIKLVQKYSSYVFYHYRDFKEMYKDIMNQKEEYLNKLKLQEFHKSIESELGVIINEE